ncbi:hypothetical protein KAR91_31895 [Candidatus Pacearchaeota archaeon]|nr:hypothetical protein [Candidatus Pacearchaeota archaeon]
MNQYTIIAGDTFATISRKVYGVETKAGLLARVNPGISEPLTPGVVIFIATQTDLPQIITESPSDSENEVALNIDDQRFRFWESMRITRSIDSMDTLEFTAPLNVDNRAFRDTFLPFSYKTASVTVGGEALFKGTMLTPIPDLTGDRKSVAVSGYSIPGVLNDCVIPASAFPLEFNGQGLRDIAKVVAAYFGISVEFTEQQGPVFERVAAEPTKKVFQFLSQLARQRNFVVSSTPEGKLLFQRSVASGKPVSRLAQGFPPITTIAPQFNPQAYYSHITGLQPAGLGVDGSQYTAENSRLKGIIRPFTFKADDTKSGDIKAAVEAKAGYMFANAISYSVSVTTWRDSEGNLWAPNTTVTLIASGAMIYSEYEFIIRSVSFSRTPNSETAELKLVLPGSFEGKIPETLPWD